MDHPASNGDHKALDGLLTVAHKALEPLRRAHKREATSLLSILGVDQRETPLVAALAWLLEPSDGHDYQHGVLQCLLTAACNVNYPGNHGSNCECKIPDNATVAVEIERHRGSSRADLLVFVNKEPKLIVEAKVHSKLGEGFADADTDSSPESTQLDRTAEDFRKFTSRLFLTPDGKCEKGEHFHSDQRWVGVSWQQISKFMAPSEQPGAPCPTNKSTSEHIRLAFGGLSEFRALTRGEKEQAVLFLEHMDEWQPIVEAKFEDRRWLRETALQEVLYGLPDGWRRPSTGATTAADSLGAWAGDSGAGCSDCWRSCYCEVILHVDRRSLTQEWRTDWLWHDEWPSLRIHICKTHSKPNVVRRLQDNGFRMLGNSRGKLIEFLVPKPEDDLKSYRERLSEACNEGRKALQAALNGEGPCHHGTEPPFAYKNGDDQSQSDLQGAYNTSPSLGWFIANHERAQAVVDAKFLAKRYLLRSLARLREIEASGTGHDHRKRVRRFPADRSCTVAD